MTTCTRESLVCNLKALGVESGDTLFTHASFKSLGPVEGGAETVVHALEDAVGPEGLLLMPSFNLVDPPRRAETWDLETTPSTVGWITEYFRRMPGTVRSDHYSHSVAARGRNAQAFVADHLSQEGFRSPWDRAPWGRTYGTHSPMHRACEADGKILMLGVDYHSSTYVHFAEVILYNKKLAEDPSAKYIYLNRTALGAFWDRVGDLRRGLVGAADCRLFRIRDYVDMLVHEVEKNPAPYLKNP